MRGSESSNSDIELRFDVTDFVGRRVFLTERTFQNHRGTHPEVDEYLAEAQEVIGDPDGVIQLDNGATVLYREGFGRGKYAGKFLSVYIRYRRVNRTESGIVATFFFQRKLPQGTTQIRYERVLGERIYVDIAGQQESESDV